MARALIRRLRAVFRRTAGRTPPPYQPTVSFEGSPTGLSIRLFTLEAFAECRQDGCFPAEVLTLPLAALADFEGRDDTLVQLERSADGQVQARWSDAGVPKLQHYEIKSLEELRKFPEEPQTLIANEPRLFKALNDAMQVAAPAQARYATDRINLHANGEIIATDGHQMLLQSGFHFPWTKDVLIPQTRAFACRELPSDQPVSIGSTSSHVTLKLGAWSFHLPADTESRFPDVASVIPSSKNGFTCWCISKQDGIFLAKTLPRLPVDVDEHEAITVDLNGQANIRSRSNGQSQPTELVLANSVVTGKPVRFRMNRPLLIRALQLGFTEMQVVDADKPALWQDPQRKYVCTVLGKEGAIPPSPDALRISSAGDKQETSPVQTAASSPESEPAPTPPEPSPSPALTEPSAVLPRAKAHRNGTSPAKASANLGELITEAAALRDAMRNVLVSSNQLVHSLQRHRKQARLVQNTLASLRQLQRFDS